MTKREFLTASIGAGLALAERTAFSQQGERRTSSRKAKTTKLFKSPQGFPNGIAVTPEGLWIGEQKLSGAQAGYVSSCPNRRTLPKQRGWWIGMASC